MTPSKPTLRQLVQELRAILEPYPSVEQTFLESGYSGAEILAAIRRIEQRYPELVEDGALARLKSVASRIGGAIKHAGKAIAGKVGSALKGKGKGPCKPGEHMTFGVCRPVGGGDDDEDDERPEPTHTTQRTKPQTHGFGPPPETSKHQTHGFGPPPETSKSHTHGFGPPPETSKHQSFGFGPPPEHTGVHTKSTKSHGDTDWDEEPEGPGNDAHKSAEWHKQKAAHHKAEKLAHEKKVSEVWRTDHKAAAHHIVQSMVHSDIEKHHAKMATASPEERKRHQAEYRRKKDLEKRGEDTPLRAIDVYSGTGD